MAPILLLCACKATPPGKFETSIMRSAEHKLLVGNRRARNPLTPSAENIAKYIHDEVLKGLPDQERVRLSQVKLWETDTCSAIYRR